MGLFSFLKKAGSSVFSDAESKAKEAAGNEKLQELLKQQKENLLKTEVIALNLDVENLEIDLNDDIATIYGQVSSQSDKEKVILAVGNVDGIASVDDRLSVTEEADESQFHTVASGESLSLIAKKYYGDPMKYKELFEANQPMLKSADLIYPGQVLRIPKL